MSFYYYYEKPLASIYRVRAALLVMNEPVFLHAHKRPCCGFDKGAFD